ncbi:7587_t:CDS:2 [Ambispora gerdemannii]|uniref:7587_t:CDS:1 n=1 Tax=Ambispora gerdemannii TaxID=144530 RepID=A0A9N8ZU58_9GLOM|nr:7587_t:CDS:2 [Ambispora gerdemannii]
MGIVHELVIIARKITSGGPKIVVDEKQKYDLPLCPDSANKLINHHKKVINLVDQQKDINLPSKEREIAFGKIGGKSGGSALYLAVLSALTKKPISAQVAATGALVANRPKKGRVNGQEISLEKGTNLPIQGLKEKTTACVEKGINHLVLSKYQSSLNLLTLF